MTREIDYEVITILGNIARDVFKLELKFDIDMHWESINAISFYLESISIWNFQHRVIWNSYNGVNFSCIVVNWKERLSGEKCFNSSMNANTKLIYIADNLSNNFINFI